MQSGPIQVLTFAFDRVDRFEGQILRELDELRSHGMIRVLDLQFVLKEADGTVQTLHERDLPDGSVSTFGTLIDPLLGLIATVEASTEQAPVAETMLSPEHGAGLDLDVIRAAVTDLAPGTAAALVLVEHAWALGLGAAITEAGGYMVAQGFLTRDALLAVGQELNAVVEAEVAIERAAAVRGAALLDTLTTLTAAEEVQREAMASAITTVVGVEAFRSTVAAEAVRALVVAGLLTEADATEAIDILVDAELISEATLDEATATADAILAELSQDW
ncbi:hypothetical protein [Candidatus Chloroploca asiatica]|uniref:DUF1269 domain-containing family protein n=1 Tax=Candidatus Chloroploca asiatica TaxID=1506545 RepID=A0A2H3KWA2_9CHLR|nr:hypothetical protein [Candidatus Chloroploca asiatica]PDV98208.1 hypothetical protein A9Q02_16335 [Candidatus Chloroploca asiatica]